MFPPLTPNFVCDMATCANSTSPSARRCGVSRASSRPVGTRKGSSARESGSCAHRVKDAIDGDHAVEHRGQMQSAAVEQLSGCLYGAIGVSGKVQVLDELAQPLDVYSLRSFIKDE